MSVEVTVPQLGESIVEATVGRWLKTEGDPVESGDALVELETDKVNQEITSTASGWSTYTFNTASLAGGSVRGMAIFFDTFDVW